MKSILLLLAALTMATGALQADVKASNRLDKFLEAFNSQDKAKVKAMIESSFSPTMFEKRKVEDWVAQTMDIATNLAPMTVEEKLVDKPSFIVVMVKARGGAKLALRIDCELDAARRITGVRIDQSADNLVSPKKKVDYSNYTDLNNLAKRIREDNKVPAIAIATWQDGKLDVVVDGIRKQGEAAPVTDKDLWLVGSIGKSMTSTLVATFIDEGKLKWDSKLGDLLKDIPMKEGYKDVTIEQLMRHRGGIPRDNGFSGQTVQRIVGDLKDPIAIREAYVKDILGRDPIGKPGETMAYSNAGYAILGHIAERVGKKPFTELMKERVFKPIGMDSAIAGQPGTEGMPGGPGQPSGHVQGEKAPIPTRLAGPLTYMAAPAGAGIAMNIGDLAKYAGWHMRGVLGEKVPGLSTASIQRLHVAPPGKGMERYAAGWLVGSDYTPSEMHAHNGSDGTFVAEMAFWPEKKMAVVGIVNMGTESSPSPGLEAVLAVYQKLFGKKG